MKRFWFSLIMSLCTIISFAFATIPLVELTNGLADMMNRDANSYSVKLNMNFFIPIVVLGIVEAMDHLWNKRRNQSSFWIYPLVTPSDDERERAITANASHAAFLTIWAVAPICAGAMCFYPLLAGFFPIYPILVVLIIPFIQITVYYFKIRKIFL